MGLINIRGDIQVDLGFQSRFDSFSTFATLFDRDFSGFRCRYLVDKYMRLAVRLGSTTWFDGTGDEIVSILDLALE